MAALARSLPAPLHSPISSFSESTTAQSQAQDLLLTQQKQRKSLIPVYGQRKGWKPTTEEDFGDGGAFPECWSAQYPLDMGRKKGSKGGTLALQVDAQGNVRYDAIAQYGRKEGEAVHSSARDLVPLSKRDEVKDKSLDRPSESAVLSTTERTRLALESITSGKIASARPSTVSLKDSSSSEYIRYTPASTSDQGKQRIIKMSTVAEDPLEPPRFKHKKIPRANDEAPPPVMQSPPRRATVQEQKDWQIPPCISNWKNNKGYTIPLDKRLAADGRGLQDIHINDNFAKFSEALYIADRHAREEVRERALMQQRLAQKEKAAKEENLRLLAQRAREERSGIVPLTMGAGGEEKKPVERGTGLGGYESGSDSDSEDSDGDARVGARAGGARDESDESSEEDEDDDAAREREKIRKEKRQERERELRLNNMGSEQRAKMLMKEQNRDISEKIALGLAKPTTSKESMYDSRLFNREANQASMGDSGSYNVYDKPLFSASTAAAAIYRPRGNARNDESFGGGTEEGISNALENDRFGLGASKFVGADEAGAEDRSGPVQFEKDVSLSMGQVQGLGEGQQGQGGDLFGLNEFMGEAVAGKKRGLDTSGASSSKRVRQD